MLVFDAVKVVCCKMHNIKKGLKGNYDRVKIHGSNKAGEQILKSGFRH